MTYFCTKFKFSFQPVFDRLDRIEAVFFPGNFDDEILESTRNEAEEPTCVEMLAGPSYRVRNKFQSKTYPIYANLTFSKFRINFA